MHVDGLAQVAPGLFLGGREAATSAALHARMRFALVVNVTNDVPRVKPASPGCEYVKVGVEDNGRAREVAKLAAALPATVGRICAALDAGGRVLVHCLMGRQRSAAVVAAVLMARDRGLDADAAIARVRAAKRDAFFPEPNFRGALLGWRGGDEAQPPPPLPPDADSGDVAHGQKCTGTDVDRLKLSNTSSWMARSGVASDTVVERWPSTYTTQSPSK